MKDLPDTERAVIILFSDGTDTIGWYRAPRHGKQGKWMHAIKNCKDVIGWRELES